MNLDVQLYMITGIFGGLFLITFCVLITLYISMYKLSKRVDGLKQNTAAVETPFGTNLPTIDAIDKYKDYKIRRAQLNESFGNVSKFSQSPTYNNVPGARLNQSFRENNSRFDDENFRDRPTKPMIHSRPPNNPLSYGSGLNQQRPAFLNDIERNPTKLSGNSRNIDMFNY